MMKCRWTGALIACFALASLSACADPEEEQQSLREALARLPQDTTTTPSAELVEQERLPLDSSVFGEPETLALPESAGILELPAAVEIERDTTPSRLRPGPPQDTEPWMPQRDSLPLAPEWTAGVREDSGDGSRMTTLESVRTARNEGFDRVVFEFESGRMPGYRIEYVDSPVRQCGSGQVVPLRGDGWLRIRLEPSQAHDDRGRATVQDRARTADLPVLRELRLICDYEGQVEWVLGVASPNRFRVIELSSPARLVVDVRH